MEKEEYILSSLGKTWIFDLDGTLVKHNGYKIDGKDTFLDGAEEFLSQIPEQDKIILLTSRTEQEKELTEYFLREHHVRFDEIIYNAPYGERILINDRKPSGLETAIAINTERDRFINARFIVDKGL